MSLTTNDLEQINTVVTGAVTASEGRLIKSLTEQMDRRFDEAALATAGLVDTVLVHMDERFAEVDERFAQVDARFDEVDKRFDRLEVRVGSLEGEVRHTNRIVRQHSLDIVELRSRA